jgi:hypothetical protein
VYKLISCWVIIIIVCLFFVGSLSFAQGLDSSSSGWAKAEEADEDANVKAEEAARAKAKAEAE